MVHGKGHALTEGQDTYGEGGSSGTLLGRWQGRRQVSAWQAAGQLPRVPGRGGSGRRGGEGTGGARVAREGDEGQDDAAEDEMPA